MTPSLDPKGAAGALKTPLHLIPPVAAAAAARVHALGAKKYGLWNFRLNQVCTTTYIAAIKRHLDAFLDGEDLDPESGESHIAHIIASGNILIDAANHGTLVDDRPPRKPTTP
jgi:hypothetical protein